MNKMYILLFVIGSFYACNNGESNADTNLKADSIEIEEGEDVPEPRFDWKAKNWDFGTIKDGDRVEPTFRFTNTGDADLIISNASASCGCTIPEWPKEPIKPGEKAKLRWNSTVQGKVGK